MFDVNIYLLLSILLAGLLTSFGKTTGLNVLGIFTVTIMSLIFPAKEAVGVLLPVLLMGDLIAVFFYRRTVVWRHLFSLVPWILIGVLIGYFVLRTSDNEQLKILLGYLILGLNLFQIIKDYFGSKIDQALPSSIWFIGLMGILAGFATMIGNVAGTVMAIYLLSHRLPKNEFVGTGAWFYLFVNIIKVPFYIQLGMITTSSFTVNLLAIPAVAIGAFVGIKVLPLIPQQMFKWIILALGSLGAMKLIVSALYDYVLIWHIAASIVCFIAGLIALLIKNRKDLRTTCGKIYCGAYPVLFITTMSLALMKWENGIYVFLVSILSFCLALLGYMASKKRVSYWRFKQNVGVIGSYIGLITAIFVIGDLSYSMISNIPTLILCLVPTIIGGLFIGWIMNKEDFEIEERHSLDIKN